MKYNSTLRIFLLVVLSFATYHFLFIHYKPSLKSWLDTYTKQGLLSYILAYFIVGFPIVITTSILNRKSNIFQSLGLSSSFLTGIWTSLLFTMPMFLGGLLFFTFQPPVSVENIIAGTIVAGFMEELYFRGFLFGQLFRKTNLGFVSSILLGALIFAFGHLHQSQNMAELIGIFFITFSGAVFFAWLYAEWNYNLWVPILTHALMNLSWVLFRIDDTALGGTKANIFRGLTIAAAIVLTLWYKKKYNRKLSINRQTLLWKKENNI